MKGLTLIPKEERRLQVLNGVLERRWRVSEAAMVLGLSARQTWRLLTAYRSQGAAALAHGNRGRAPWNRLAAAVREQVVALAKSPLYEGCNHQHFTELLAEREGIALSRPTVRRYVCAAGLRSPRKRRAPKHRSRRERMPQEGMLVQWDGSRHDWLEGRGPWLTLVGSIDDARGTVPAAHFRQQEDAQGYFLVLRDILITQGVPLAIYRDRHGIFERRAQDAWTRAEELVGEQLPTQVARALAELGIQSIPAYSPQAKGRIERLWETFQDRLVIELRLAEASTLEAAEAVLQAYLPRFNARFEVAPAESERAYRPLPTGLKVDQVCCFKYQRTVAPDNTVRLESQRLQLLPDPYRASYARAQVEVHERLDGSLAAYYQGRCLATTPAPLEAPVLRARSGKRVPGSHTPLRQEPPVKATTITAVAVGKWTTPDRMSEPLPQVVVHLSTAGGRLRTPAPDHPWRKGSQKRTGLTKSLTT
jgi:hypothetical protein